MPQRPVDLGHGVLGKVFWEQTGAFGLGACARATGPPAAGGSLATYVDPEFIRANVALINDPNTVVEAYTAKFRAESLNAIGRYLLVGTVLGGALIYVLLPWARMRIAPLASELVIGSVLLVVATCTSTLVAMRLFDQWSGDQEVNTYYAMPGNDRLGFDNPQALEVARQVKPFVEKNLERIREVADRYEVTAAATFATELAGKLTQVTPGEGEIVVLGEADPQGSLVGGRVREALYEQLVAAIGADSVALRVIAGDVTSNGTVAESTYVEAEAGIAPGIPIAAVGGDHDSEQTWQQMADNGIQVPDFGTVDVAGLKVSGANDREHKTLFGGLVLNDEGIGERELGEKLRDAVGDESQIVLLHQPVAAAGYLGLEDLTSLRGLSDDSRVPYEDGVPDVPPASSRSGICTRPTDPGCSGTPTVKRSPGPSSTNSVLPVGYRIGRRSTSSALRYLRRSSH